jgi:hypothetical protein
VQPTAAAKALATATLEPQDIHPVSMHLRLLSLNVGMWRDYLKQIDQKIWDMVRLCLHQSLDAHSRLTIIGPKRQVQKSRGFKPWPQFPYVDRERSTAKIHPRFPGESRDDPEIEHRYPSSASEFRTDHLRHQSSSFRRISEGYGGRSTSLPLSIPHVQTMGRGLPRPREGHCFVGEYFCRRYWVHGLSQLTPAVSRRKPSLHTSSMGPLTKAAWTQPEWLRPPKRTLEICWH